MAFTLPLSRLPEGFAPLTEAELRSAPNVTVLWMASCKMALAQGEPFWILAASRMDSVPNPALAKMTHLRASFVRSAAIRRTMCINRRINHSSLGGKFPGEP